MQYMGISDLNAVSFESSLFFEGVGGTEGRSYVVSHYVIRNR